MNEQKQVVEWRNNTNAHIASLDLAEAEAYKRTVASRKELADWYLDLSGAYAEDLICVIDADSRQRFFDAYNMDPVRGLETLAIKIGYVPLIATRHSVRRGTNGRTETTDYLHMSLLLTKRIEPVVASLFLVGREFDRPLEVAAFVSPGCRWVRRPRAVDFFFFLGDGRSIFEQFAERVRTDAVTRICLRRPT